MYRAVDKEGQSVDFLLTAKRDKVAALRFVEKAMKTSGIPEKVTRWTRAAPTKRPWVKSMAEAKRPSSNAQVNYLNNIVEQDHRAVKRVTKLMLNFKSLRAARNILAGIERMHMIRKGQLLLQGCIKLSSRDKFYALAGHIRSV